MIEKTGGNRKLAYKKEMRDVLRENPGVVKTVLSLVSELEKEAVGTELQKDGVRVKFFARRNFSDSFRVDLGSESYFLRKERARETGFNAMRSFEEAEKRFENRKDIRVIDSQLGYTDSRGNDYFAAKWENLPVLADYLGQDLSDEERKFIADMLEYIYDTLSDFQDVTTNNMFYDPAQKQIVLFDLEKEPG